MSDQQSTRPQMGAPPEIQRLYSLIGEWDVQFESRPSADAAFTMHRIPSSIISVLGGAFLQEQIAIPASSGTVNLIGLLGYDRYRETYRFAWLDDTYAVFDVHEGNWDGEALVVNNLRSATTFRFGDQDYFSRMVWREITADEFKIESDVSTDAGKTWFTQAKGHYIRRA
jgi:hypothetical protein